MGWLDYAGIVGRPGEPRRIEGWRRFHDVRLASAPETGRVWQETQFCWCGTLSSRRVGEHSAGGYRRSCVSQVRIDSEMIPTIQGMK
jgi:hypothetical protein